MKRVGINLAMAIGMLALAACGNSTGDRGLSGAGIGAAVGAVGGALVGAPLAGAAIGAGVGAATGALTSPSTVDALPSAAAPSMIDPIRRAHRTAAAGGAMSSPNTSSVPKKK